MNDKSSSNYIELTADIVSAYVSNNVVAAGDISALISQVHSALLRVSNGQSEVVSEALKPAIAEISMPQRGTEQAMQRDERNQVADVQMHRKVNCNAACTDEPCAE